MRLAVTLIREDGGTQSRAQLNVEALKSYAEAMREGATFPPVVVFYDGKEYWLADGFHRVAAALDAPIPELEADVRQGTRRDAVLFSVGANALHGVQRSNADKRRAVELLTSDEEWGAWSDRKIADVCRVSHTFVSKIRASRAVVAEAPMESTTFVRGQERSAEPARPRMAPVAALPVAEPPPVSTRDDELHNAGRLEDRLVALTNDICEASARTRRLLVPALENAVRRLSGITRGNAA